MNGALIGYRKVLIIVLGMLATWAINKGMSPELAGSLQGMLVEVIPTILAAIFVHANIQAKKVTANGTTATATSSTAAGPAVAPAPAPAPIVEPAPVASAPVAQPAQPTPDVNPYWTGEDEQLVPKQKEGLQELYNRQITSPPKTLKLPKTDSTLYMDKQADYEKRYFTVSADLMNQAQAIFKESDREAILALRASCDVAIWRRVQYHFAEAKGRWMEYGLAVWHWQDRTG